jgi:hypothetical protein
MNRPNCISVRRPKTAGSGTARSRKDAAIQLVRLEFDISRLEQTILQADQRAAQARAELSQQIAEREKLMSRLRD